MAEKALSLLEEETEIIHRVSSPTLDLIETHHLSDEEILRESGLAREDLGQREGLLRAILTFVISQEFDKALNELQLYNDSKFNYPNFEHRAERHVQYAKDLINAVKAKREFSAKAHLRNSKQQELQEKVYSHYKELKLTLRRIEAIDRELRLDDVKSTVIFLKGSLATVCVVLGVLFIREIIEDRHPQSWWYAMKDFVLKFSGYIFEIIGL